MKTEFTTFRIKMGKEKLAEEWMRELKNRQDECVQTLEREKMLFESIFKYFKDGYMFLSWFSVQEENHKKVETSDFEIDKLHLKYWEECIDMSYVPDDHEHVVSFVPTEINAWLKQLYNS